MKINGEKCPLIFFSNMKNTDITINIDNELIHESSEETLLCVILDKTSSFKAHVLSLYKKANQKLHARSRISYYMDSEKLKNIMKAFILSQFNYSPLVWIHSERCLNNKINHHKGDESDFETLLEKTML